MYCIVLWILIFPPSWLRVRGVHWALVASHTRGQQCRTLMFSYLFAKTYCWTNCKIAGECKCQGDHEVLSLWRVISHGIFFIGYSNQCTNRNHLHVLICCIIVVQHIVDISCIIFDCWGLSFVQVGPNGVQENRPSHGPMMIFMCNVT